MKKYFAALALFTAVASFTRAQTITFLNPSFETPTPSGGANFAGTPTDWTGVNDAGTFQPSVNNIAPPAPDGAQWAYVSSGATLTQSVSNTFLVNKTYTFSIDMGARGDQIGGATGFISLGYIDSGSSFVELANQSATLASGSASSGFVTGVYNTGSSGAELSMPVAIRLSNFATNQALFDNLQVSVSAIPEPSTYAVIFGGLALGVTALQRMRRRKLAA